MLLLLLLLHCGLLLLLLLHLLELILLLHQVQPADSRKARPHRCHQSIDRMPFSQQHDAHHELARLSPSALLRRACVQARGGIGHGTRGAVAVQLWPTG